MTSQNGGSKTTNRNIGLKFFMHGLVIGLHLLKLKKICLCKRNSFNIIYPKECSFKVLDKSNEFQ